MDKDILSKFLDHLVLEVGQATIDSKKTKEASIAVNISLQLRPSVLARLTSMLDRALPKFLEGEKRQDHLAQSLSLFLSDAIDCGILEGAHQIVKGKTYHEHSRSS